MIPFSIDVQAHLDLVAQHTFSSAAYFPLEMVRAALRRGAQRVELRISSRGLYLRDDSRGMSVQELEMLRCLLNPDVSAFAREETIIKLQQPEHHGLLALFTAQAKGITINNPGNGSGLSLSWINGRLHQRAAEAPADFSVQVLTKPRNSAQEMRLLRYCCRSVTCDIRLNGRKISGHFFFKTCLAKKALTLPGGGSGELSVRRSGYVCRLWLLDQGIPYKHISVQPTTGYIFDAACEYHGTVTHGFLYRLAETARDLYTLLTASRDHAPPVQRRIDALLLQYYRITGQFQDFPNHRPFRLPQGPSSLADVISAAKKPLYAMVSERPGQGRAGAVFTAKQADFLINRVGLAIVVNAGDTTAARLPARLRLRKWGRHVRSGICSLVYSLIKGRETGSAAEKRFLSQLHAHLRTMESPLRVSFCSAWGMGPVLRCLKQAPGGRRRLQLCRSNRLIKRWQARVAEDPANMAILAAWLATWWRN